MECQKSVMKKVGRDIWRSRGPFLYSAAAAACCCQRHHSHHDLREEEENKKWSYTSQEFLLHVRAATTTHIICGIVPFTTSSTYMVAGGIVEFRKNLKIHFYKTLN